MYKLTVGRLKDELARQTVFNTEARSTILTLKVGLRMYVCMYSNVCMYVCYFFPFNVSFYGKAIDILTTLIINIRANFFIYIITYIHTYI